MSGVDKDKDDTPNRPGDAMQSGTDKLWKKPGELSQTGGKPPAKPDLEKWQESNTH